MGEVAATAGRDPACICRVRPIQASMLSSTTRKARLAMRLLRALPEPGRVLPCQKRDLSISGYMGVCGIFFICFLLFPSLSPGPGFAREHRGSKLRKTGAGAFAGRLSFSSGDHTGENAVARSI